MKNTTLGYIEYDGKFLMLLRDVNKNDGSLGKWLGIGGKLEKKENADEPPYRILRIKLCRGLYACFREYQKPHGLLFQAFSGLKGRAHRACGCRANRGHNIQVQDLGHNIFLY